MPKKEPFMLAAAIPPNEKQRIEAVRAANILDTHPEERFDRLTRLAKRLFGVPMAVVSVVDTDRQWFKSADGLLAKETPRNVAFCSHAILGNDIFMVSDTAQDERFVDNPLVTGNPNIRFYAGCPLVVEGGHKLGTLCLLDTKPRELNDEDQDLLKDLARMAEQEMSAVRLATLDDLTHLSNRRGFEQLAQHALDSCARNEKAASLFYLDLDQFKAINDSFGHAEGDEALKAFSRALHAAFGGSGAGGEAGVISRQGGDEFVVLLPGADELGAIKALGRLRAAVDAENKKARNQGYRIAFSVGKIGVQPGASARIADLLRQADAAMYANKQARRGVRAA